jgi:hypothetical protein
MSATPVPIIKLDLKHLEDLKLCESIISVYRKICPLKFSSNRVSLSQKSKSALSYKFIIQGKRSSSVYKELLM